MTEATPLQLLQDLGFDLHCRSHAAAILTQDFPGALGEIAGALASLRLPVTEIIGSGGGETQFTQRLRHALDQSGWKKHNFKVEKTIDGVLLESISHEIDHVKTFPGGTVAMEIEWNNKDPFFDRDLDNFKRLHAEGAISLGVILTRGVSLQEGMRDFVMKFAEDRGIENFDDLKANGYTPTPKQGEAVLRQVRRAHNPMPFREAWTRNFVGNKYGAATTHWRKLMDRMDRGVGSPCPLLLLGLPGSIVTFDEGKVDMMDDTDA